MTLLSGAESDTESDAESGAMGPVEVNEPWDSYTMMGEEPWAGAYTRPLFSST
jgi:hypothetical protein